MPRYCYNMADERRNNNCGNSCMAGNAQSNCGCMRKDNDTERTQKMVLAMAYVPWQHWGKLYDLNQGFMEGTIFADLNKPFRGTGGCCNGR